MSIDKLVETAQKYNCMIVTKDMWNTALCSVYKLQKIEQIAREGKNESRCEKILEIIEDENN